MNDHRTPVERLLPREDLPAAISRRAAQTPRSVEAYLEAGNPPRWMERLGEIDRGIANVKRRLERAHRALAERHAGEPVVFARHWREIAESWRFDELNELIAQHNEWYPIERRLAIDLRTRDYVLIHGRSYRRPVLDADWVLEQFPASAGPPRPPSGTASPPGGATSA
jgi:hypothetical protein